MVNALIISIQVVSSSSLISVGSHPAFHRSHGMSDALRSFMKSMIQSGRMIVEIILSIVNDLGRGIAEMLVLVRAREKTIAEVYCGYWKAQR